MIDTQRAFARYETLRAALPAATFPAASKYGQDLSDTVDDFDAYILDAFGVLNRGETAIAGAVKRMAGLRAAGKRLIVLTNAASYTRTGILAKYHRLGFDFGAEEVVSSRDVAFANLPKLEKGLHWAAICAEGDSFNDAPASASLRDFAEFPGLIEHAGGFLFLSTARWKDPDTEALITALAANPRPLVIANPDLVAPREFGLTIEPGMIGHRIAERTNAEVMFFGKPYVNAFSAALARLNGVSRNRIAMVGDTLHTDVLGGAAAGIRTILVTDHGLFAGQDVMPFISSSKIRPDWIVATT
ncbi:HAD-superfamily hydrolase, subfamily IIA [Roseobacter sp. SK209-2-6]|uniref:HAD-IIA family hydrolase n=1 Tax=Roseobacter sp. SK209-2-6 TaxID=388739 RepID=UPI0000F3EDF7|nr:HAD hydrolase-like protein [Roseobacter sp. SK209-2-6]EBA15627.1 HAD-superfamily hydrolase, subfamily IIA [Roseobacter sp. SK209-2-6]